MQHDRSKYPVNGHDSFCGFIEKLENGQYNEAEILAFREKKNSAVKPLQIVLIGVASVAIIVAAIIVTVVIVRKKKITEKDVETVPDEE